MEIVDYSMGVYRITVHHGVECYIMLLESEKMAMVAQLRILFYEDQNHFYNFIITSISFLRRNIWCLKQPDRI